MKNRKMKTVIRGKNSWKPDGYLKIILLIIAMSVSLPACEYANSTGLSQASANNQTQTNDSLNDKDITLAIEREILTQDGVLSYRIDVETQKGIVTLTGTTNNILEKERATDIAQMVRGVRGVVNRIDVEKTDLSDAAIRRNIERALLYDPAADVYEVGVSVDKGTVTLNGTVDSWQEKQLAEKVAKGVKGVVDLENNISFHYKGDRTDSEIQHDIEQSLKWDIRIGDGLVHVDVDDGIATLSGIVGSAAEKNQTEINAWVAGVSSVDASELDVEPWAKKEDLRQNKYQGRDDEQISEAITDAFFYDPRVFSPNPEITVNNGRVTLSGTVRNLKAKQAAERVANTITGVWKVDNMLKVRYPEGYSDEDIKSRLESSLVADPYVERFEIDIEVSNGVVYLDGAVDNYFEKWKAKDLVSSIKGVELVFNNIDIEDGDASPYVFDYYHHYYHPFRHYGYQRPVSLKRDMDIKDDIESELWWSPYVSLNDVTVLVDDGVATLTGSVDSWLEYRHAEQNAFDGGAAMVDNELIIN